GRAERAVEVVHQDRLGEEVVDGPVEEALDLSRAQIDAHDAVGARRLEQDGDQTGTDRLTPSALLVVAGIAVVRSDDRDAPARGTLGRTDHDEALPEPLVDRFAERLDEEEIAAADRHLEAGVDLTRGEGAMLGRGDLCSQTSRDGRGQLGVRATSCDDESLLRLGDAPRGYAVFTIQLNGLLLAPHDLPYSAALLALDAASAAPVPARFFSTHPSTFR